MDGRELDIATAMEVMVDEKWGRLEEGRTEPAVDACIGGRADKGRETTDSLTGSEGAGVTSADGGTE